MGAGLDAQTRLAAVIGDPVRHSRSPVLHNAAFEATGLNWAYVAFPVAAGSAAAALAAMRVLGIEGLSVTMPHKADVAAAVDRCSPAATRLGAVNCVRREGDVLIGENTDGIGFVRSLRGELGFDPAGTSVAVLGAGGAARAVIVALVEAGVRSLAVVARNAVTGARAVELAGPVGALADANSLREVDLIVNATPVGMFDNDEDPTAVPFDPAIIRPGQIVADLIYHPPETALLAAARERGATVINGVGMLLHQAAEAFELWTGTQAPIEVMREALLGSLDDERT